MKILLSILFIFMLSFSIVSESMANENENDDTQKNEAVKEKPEVEKKSVIFDVLDRIPEIEKCRPKPLEKQCGWFRARHSDLRQTQTHPKTVMWKDPCSTQ